MPGVLIIEAMAQTAGAICICAKARTDKPSLVYFMTIDNAKFRKPSCPATGSNCTSGKSSSAAISGGSPARRMVDGAKVAEAEISAMMLAKLAS